EKGAFTDWVQAARWLGDFHGRFLDNEGTLRRAIPGLPGYRRSHYLRAAEAADRVLLRSREIDDRWSKIRRRDQERLHAVVEFFPKAARRLLDEPPTLIHGDCYGHNILLRPHARPTVCFVDWETVAIGPGILDLSALLLWWGPTESDILIDHYL